MWHKVMVGLKSVLLGRFFVMLGCAVCALLLWVAPAQAAETPPDTGLLYQLMAAEPEKFGKILTQPEVYEVQALLTEIRRDAYHIPTLISYGYNLDTKHYFYPASTVKLPIAALTLQKLYQLDRPELNRDCRLLRGSRQSGEVIADYIQRIFYYSDNNAYDCLYDFLGVDYINATLHGMGYADCLIFRKFTYTNARQDGNTPPVALINNGVKVYEQPAQTIKAPYSLDDFGLNHLIRGHRSNKNFRDWNYVSIENLQLMLQAIVLPQTVEARYRYDISEDDRLFLMDCMLGDGDAGHKYFLYGGTGTPAEGVEIYNKTGTGYGNIVDNAYIVDRQQGIEFLLTAVIYANPNGVMGDDIYAYDSVGMPFLRDFGNAVYKYLLEQKGGSGQ